MGSLRLTTTPCFKRDAILIFCCVPLPILDVEYDVFKLHV